MSKPSNYIIKLGTFDPERLIVGDPRKLEYAKAKVTVTSMPLSYLNDAGEQCEVIVELKKQSTSGIFPNYPFDSNEKDDVRINGLSFPYPLTSYNSVNNPDKDEQYCIDTITKIWEKVVEKCKSEMKKASAYDAYTRELESVEKSKGGDKAAKLKEIKAKWKPEPSPSELPDATCNSIISAEQRRGGDYRYAVKFPFDYQNKKDSSEKDFTKPMTMFVKLKTFGQGMDKIKMDKRTVIYLPGRIIANPIKLLKTRGEIKPAIHFTDVFCGGHGSKAPYGASIRFNLKEAIFKPLDDSPPPQLLDDEEDGDRDDLIGKEFTLTNSIITNNNNNYSDEKDPTEALSSLDVKDDKVTTTVKKVLKKKRDE